MKPIRIPYTRIIAMLLVLVCMLGLLPATALAASPSTIVMGDCTHNGVHYESPSLGTCRLHQMHFDYEGASTMGFCAEKGKGMGWTLEGHTWNDPKSISDPTVETMMAYFYAHSTGVFTDRAKALGLDTVWSSDYIWTMNAWVQAIMIGKLTVTYEKYTLTVRKVDSTNPNKGLPGARFLVASENGAYSKEVVTGSDGTYTLRDLDASTYAITELSPPEGYEIDNAGPQYVVLPNESGTTVTVTFTDTLVITGEGSIRKVDADNPTRGLAGAVIKIEGVDNSFAGTYTTGAGGYLTDVPWDTMPIGSFVATEITPPSGYSTSSDPNKVRQEFYWDGKSDVDLIFENDAKVDQATVEGGGTVTVTAADQRLPNLTILKRDGQTGAVIPDTVFEIKGIHYGYHMDVTTGRDGKAILTGIPVDSYEVTEVSVPDPYVVSDEPTQTIWLGPGDDQELVFDNLKQPQITIAKVDAADSTTPIPGTVFTIEGIDSDYQNDVTTGQDGTVSLRVAPATIDYGIILTDANGEIKLHEQGKRLYPGEFTITEVEPAPGFQMKEPSTQKVILHGGESRTVTFYNTLTTTLIIEKYADTGTGADTAVPLKGVTFLVTDSSGAVIGNSNGEYITDEAGRIVITDLEPGTTVTAREIKTVEGYVDDANGHLSSKGLYTTDENDEIHISGITGTAAGTPLQGAVYEIVQERSGKVVDYITTDARGVAASKPLPLGRYKIVEVTAPAYWQLDPTVHDVTLEFAGQIIKLSAYDKPSSLGVSITKRGNASVLASSAMRYDFTVANTSNVDLESFFWHDKIPYDIARATVLTTGTYSARLNYRILYKTNYNSTYQVLASNLLTSSSYSFSLNAIPMQAGEVVTDVYFDFGKVPVGFQSTANPTLSVVVSGNAVNGYQMVNRADVGGKYQGTWQTAQASWVTIIQKLWNTPDLPKTGY